MIAIEVVIKDAEETSRRKSMQLNNATILYDDFWNWINTVDYTQGWARDVKARDRDAHLPRRRQDRDVGFTSRYETETRRWYVSRPRRRDRDHNPDYTFAFTRWTADITACVEGDSVMRRWQWRCRYVKASQDQFARLRSCSAAAAANTVNAVRTTLVE